MSVHRAARTAYYREREYERVRQPRKCNPRTTRIIGIDGEGKGRNPHLYTYLGAADENGATWSIDSSSGIRTIDALEFLLGLPTRTLVVGYAFQYDLTKILSDLPDQDLYDLVHEETRQFVNEDGRVLYRPVKWQNYKLNYINRRVSITSGSRSVTIWDIFRFFQGKFTTALRDWKIGNQEQISYIAGMKEKRSEFDKVDTGKVQEYCLEECKHLATLTRSLLTAHEDAGLPLKNYFGAGSTASSFLTKIGIAEKRGIVPDAMKGPVAAAFFGGRFENSVIGPVEKPCWNYDISSAYPYQTTFLPCLEHGTWERTTQYNDIGEANLALIHWEYRSKNPPDSPWGTLPIRATDGSIVFPLGARSGWCWMDEFFAAQDLAPVEWSEAWVYRTPCDCRPFAEIPNYYRERLRLGKEAKGIVIKLGLNSIYGKLAQSKGLDPPYQSWIWAGNITSGTRAQLLQSIKLARNPASILMFATDGVWSAEKLTFPLPRNTGTFDTPKPLGGWEEKSFPQGVFCVRPGIYFPLHPTDAQLKEVRARGLGKKILYEQWAKIVAAWDRKEGGLTIDGLSRFTGIRGGVWKGQKGVMRRGTNFGEWTPYKIDVSFDAKPKRFRARSDGSLECWKYLDWESVPYEAAMSMDKALNEDVICEE